VAPFLSFIDDVEHAPTSQPPLSGTAACAPGDCAADTLLTRKDAGGDTEFQIFRDSRRLTRAGELVARLERELKCSASRAVIDLLDLLLLAGEMECSSADAGVPQFQNAAACGLTDLLAGAAVADEGCRTRAVGPLAHSALRLLQRINYSGPVDVRTPEGFAYYAIHPLAYAGLIARNKPRSLAFVVGIRSIGTTLSAVVRAKLRSLGVEVERTTVRPTGHPYDRECHWEPSQRQAISRALAGGAEFMVCDEGPGRSGSSLLSVAEALERERVPAERILMLCSHEPDVNALCARDATRRWRRYRFAAAEIAGRLPAKAEQYIGGGQWRRALLPDRPWPAVWPQMERLKYLSRDAQELSTFEGYGPYGAPASARNRHLSNAGFGAPYLGHDGGFGRHSLCDGRLLRQRDLTPGLLARMAEYCAWRAREFCCPDAPSSGLIEITQGNFEREFERDFAGLDLPVARVVICDNRMAPHHWLLAQGGRVLKLDAALHGDDHFFPGPCDIAWDLAGIIVEWSLESSACEFLLERYRHCSGDDASARIGNYKLAYAMFRLAWSRMAAASSVGDPQEQGRLLQDACRFRAAMRSGNAGFRTAETYRL
jgi:hypothetical protein